MEPEIWRSLPEQWESGTDILMEAKIWQALPQDLLLKIFYMLPMRLLAKMRTLSRQWKQLLSSDALQRIYSNFSVHSFPGFLVQLDWTRERIAETWVIEYLGGDSSDMNIYKAPLPSDVVIVDACRNIYCSHRRGDRLGLSIGNIATGSSRRLPNPSPLIWWSFIAMDFDATRRRCTVLLGENNNRWGQAADNNMVMQIYDSESNAWTMVAMKVPLRVCPIGKGICSKGKVYWITSRHGIGRMIAFSIAERRWAEIGLPQFCQCDSLPRRLDLGGSDGRVVLIVYSNSCLWTRMWKLKEGPGAPEWCEPNPIWRPEVPNIYTVGANSSGWTVMFDWDMKITICNPKRRLIRRFTLPFRRFTFFCRIFASAFESNNVCWP